MPGDTDRFTFHKDQWSFPKESPGAAVFVSGEDGLIKEMKKHPEKIALVTRHKKN